MVTCSGSITGIRSSHRSEAGGMFSAARFIYHLSRFTGYQFPTKLRFTANNKGLIDRINSRLGYVVSYPNATLAPDWDLIELIYQSILELVTPAFDHVKGHQDSHCDYEDLPLVAQLNVDADELATTAKYIEYDAPVPPLVRVHLYIGGKLITTKYKQYIRNAASLPDFHRYQRKLYHWNLPTFSDIDLKILNNRIFEVMGNLNNEGIVAVFTVNTVMHLSMSRPSPPGQSKATL